MRVSLRGPSNNLRASQTQQALALILSSVDIVCQELGVRAHHLRANQGTERSSMEKSHAQESGGQRHDGRKGAVPPPDEETERISPSGSRGTLDTVVFVLAVGLIYFNTWGLLLAFGVFQDYLQSAYLSEFSSSAISWVGTSWAALMLFGGTVTGPAYDWGFAQHLLLGGSFMIVFGMMMFSISHTYYQAFLAQGLCVGIGSGMLYIPSLAAVAQSFDQGRSRAIGLASCGASIGGIAYPVIFRRLLPSIGFGWTVRVMAFVALSTLLIALSVLVPRCRFEGVPGRRWIDPTAFVDVPFLAYCASGFCILLGYYIPFVYIPTAARQVGASPDLVFYMVAITNAGSIVGRSLPTWIADRFGAVYMLVAATLCSALLLFCWLAVGSVAGLIVWCVCWGAASGLVVALPGSVLPDLTPDSALLGTRMGMAWTCCAIGLLIGSPIGGALTSVDDGGGLWPMQIFAAAAMLLGGGLCVIPAVHLWRRESK